MKANHIFPFDDQRWYHTQQGLEDGLENPNWCVDDQQAASFPVMAPLPPTPRSVEREAHHFPNPLLLGADLQEHDREQEMSSEVFAQGRVSSFDPEDQAEAVRDSRSLGPIWALLHGGSAHNLQDRSLSNRAAQCQHHEERGFMAQSRPGNTRLSSPFVSPTNLATMLPLSATQRLPRLPRPATRPRLGPRNLELNCQHSKDNHQNYPSVNEPLPVGVTFEQICREYPNHLWGNILLEFDEAGWSEEQIWRTCPVDGRYNRQKGREWNYLQQRLRRVKTDNGMLVPGPPNPNKGRKSKRKIEESERSDPNRVAGIDGPNRSNRERPEKRGRKSAQGQVLGRASNSAQLSQPSTPMKRHFSVDRQVTSATKRPANHQFQPKLRGSLPLADRRRPLLQTASEQQLRYRIVHVTAMVRREQNEQLQILLQTMRLHPYFDTLNPERQKLAATKFWLQRFNQWKAELETKSGVTAEEAGDEISTLRIIARRQRDAGYAFQSGSPHSELEIELGCWNQYYRDISEWTQSWRHRLEDMTKFKSPVRDTMTAPPGMQPALPMAVTPVPRPHSEPIRYQNIHPKTSNLPSPWYQQINTSGPQPEIPPELASGSDICAEKVLSNTSKGPQSSFDRHNSHDVFHDTEYTSQPMLVAGTPHNQVRDGPVAQDPAEVTRLLLNDSSAIPEFIVDPDFDDSSIGGIPEKTGSDDLPPDSSWDIHHESTLLFPDEPRPDDLKDTSKASGLRDILERYQNSLPDIALMPLRKREQQDTQMHPDEMVRVLNRHFNPQHRSGMDSVDFRKVVKTWLDKRLRQAKEARDGDTGLVQVEDVPTGPTRGAPPRPDSEENVAHSRADIDYLRGKLHAKLVDEKPITDNMFSDAAVIAWSETSPTAGALLHDLKARRNLPARE